jgi:hypothetical protein
MHVNGTVMHAPTPDTTYRWSLGVKGPWVQIPPARPHQSGFVKVRLALWSQFGHKRGGGAVIE